MRDKRWGVRPFTNLSATNLSATYLTPRPRLDDINLLEGFTELLDKDYDLQLRKALATWDSPKAINSPLVVPGVYERVFLDCPRSGPSSCGALLATLEREAEEESLRVFSPFRREIKGIQPGELVLFDRDWLDKRKV